MDTRRALLVDAFTSEPLAGNGAGVIPDAEGLTDEQMQAIAGEFAQSETAFLLPSETADRRVRYFTPTMEVDLCGHATVASHAFLFKDGRAAVGTHTLETNVGTLDIEIEETGLVWMTQDDPEVHELNEVEHVEVAEALGVDPAALRDVGADLPLAYASTGLPFLVVPVNFLEHLGQIDPDMEDLEALTDSVDALGVYAFTFDALEGGSTLHGRMFAPSAGVPEDPVTGTASGACGAYLQRFNAFDVMPEEMIFEQGDFVDRPGRVHIRVGDEVRVGGYAVTSLDGRLAVPDRGPDDIIEV